MPNDIQKVFDEYKEAKIRLEKAQQSVDFLKSLIQDYFQSTNSTKYSDDTDTIQYIKTVITSYDIDRMKKFFGKQEFKNCTDRTITIDEAAMREIFAEHPEIKSLVKSAFVTSYTPNKKKLEKAFADGKFSVEDLEKFADVSTSYSLRVSANKENKDE